MTDYTELATILVIATITIVTLALLKGEGTEIAATGLGGLVGYLTKSLK